MSTIYNIPIYHMLMRISRAKNDLHINNDQLLILN